MFHSKAFRFFSKIFITLAVISVCAISYLNFGRVAQPDETTFTSLTALQTRLAHSHPTAVTLESCKKSIQYSCAEKAFSQSAKTAESTASFPCVTVSSGVSLCSTGHTYTYDSSAAAKKCLGDDCTAQYNFNEYTCVYLQTNENGTSPIQATAASYDQAINDTYKACVVVAQASTAVANNAGAQ